MSIQEEREQREERERQGTMNGRHARGRGRWEGRSKKQEGMGERTAGVRVRERRREGKCEWHISRRGQLVIYK